MAEDESTPPPAAPVLEMEGGALLTLDEAKLWARETDPAREPELQFMIDLASSHVRRRLKTAFNDPTWTPATVPKSIKGGAAHLFGYLWAHRGDDAADLGNPQKIDQLLDLFLSLATDPTVA